MPYYPPAGSGSGYSIIQDHTTPLTSRTTINFTGAGVTASDTGGLTQVSIPGGAGASWTEIEVDFGFAPVSEAQFTITDGTVSGSSKIIVSQSGNTATGRLAGDALWDTIGYAAIAGTGSFTLYAKANPGPVAGKRKLFYVVA